MSKKKIMAIISVVLVVGVAGILFMFTQNKEEAYRIIKVMEIQGDVSLYRSSLGELEIYEDMRLESEDELVVDANSHVYLSLDDDKYLYVDEDSKIVIEASGNETDSKTKIKIEKGNVISEVKNPLSAKSTFEVETPNSTMSVRGTVFSVDVKYDQYNNSYTKMAVFDGKVSSTLVFPDGTTAKEVLVPTNYEVLVHGDEVISEYVLRGKEVEGSLSDEIYPINVDELPVKTIEVLLKLVEEKEVEELNLSKELLEAIYEAKKDEHKHLENEEKVKLYYYNEKNELTVTEEYNFSDLISLEPQYKEGYKFEGWYLDSEYTLVATTPFLIKEDTKLYPKYSIDRNVSYTVEYYEENLDGGYALVDVTSNEGAYKEKVSAVVQERTGFKFNNDKSIISAVLSDEGKIVLRVYYDRNIIKYFVDGKEYSGKYEEVVNLKESTREGYKFKEFNTHKDGTGQKINSPVTLKDTFEAYSIFTPREDIVYKVKLYFEQLDNTYKLDETIILNGTADKDVTYTPKKVDGYTLESDSYSVNVKPDGSSVIEVKYNRNIIKYYVDGKEYSGKYQEVVNLVQATKEGYKFKAFNTHKDGKGQSINSPITLQNTFEVYSIFAPREDVKYKIENYYQELDGSYKLHDTKQAQGIADSDISYVPSSVNGYTPENSSYKLTIKADGSSVLQVKYNRNNIKYYLDDKEYSGKYGQEIILEELSKEGYDFLGYYDTKDSSGTKYDKFTLEEEISLYSVFEVTEFEYSIKTYMEKVDGSGYELTKVSVGSAKANALIEYIPLVEEGFTADKDKYELTIDPKGTNVIEVKYSRNSIKYYLDDKEYTGKYGQEIVLEEISKVGYDFLGYYDTKDATGTRYEKFTLKEEVRLYSVFKIAQVEYKINIYTQNIDDDEYYLEGTKIAKAEAMSMIDITPETKKGFTPDKNVYSLYINPDGSSELDIYYKRKTISYTLDGVSYSGRYGQKITLAMPIVKEGYMFKEFNTKQDGTGSKVNASFDLYKSFDIYSIIVPRNDIKYTVKLLFENIDGSFETEVNEWKGTADSTIVYIPDKYPGFTCEDQYELVVNPNGTSVLEVKYMRDTIAYTICPDLQNIDDDGYTHSDEEKINGTVKYGEEITYNLKEIEGFVPAEEDSYKFTVIPDENGDTTFHVKYNRRLIKYSIDNAEQIEVRYGKEVTVPNVKDNKVFIGVYYLPDGNGKLYSENSTFIINSENDTLKLYTYYQHQYNINITHPDGNEETLIKYDSYNLDEYKKSGYKMITDIVDVNKDDGVTDINIKYEPISVVVHNYNASNGAYVEMRNYITNDLTSYPNELTYSMIVDKLVQDEISLDEYYYDESCVTMLQDDDKFYDDIHIYSKKFDTSVSITINARGIVEQTKDPVGIIAVTKDNLCIGGTYNYQDLYDNPVLKNLQSSLIKDQKLTFYITPSIVANKTINIDYDYRDGYSEVYLYNSSSTLVNKFIYPIGKELNLSYFNHEVTWYYEENGNKVDIPDNKLVINGNVHIYQK